MTRSSAMDGEPCSPREKASLVFMASFLGKYSVSGAMPMLIAHMVSECSKTADPHKVITKKPIIEPFSRGAKEFAT